MIDAAHIGAPSPMFVRQLGEKLSTQRKATRRPLWYLATRSEGRFDVATLRDAEAGLLPLDAANVAELAALYGLDVATVLPQRRDGVVIDPVGVITAGGRSMSFDPNDQTSLVSTYFSLIRSLRSTSRHEQLNLRQDDVGVIAKFPDAQGQGTNLLEAIVAVAEAQRRITVSSLIAGAASVGLIDLPPDAGSHLSSDEHAPIAGSTAMYYPVDSVATA